MESTAAGVVDAIIRSEPTVAFNAMQDLMQDRATSAVASMIRPEGESAPEPVVAPEGGAE